MTSFVDVVNDEPRYRRDVRVPRPLGLVRMTVATGTVENVFDLRRHLRVSFDGLRLVDRRIRSRGPDELKPKKENRERDDEEFYYF